MELKEFIMERFSPVIMVISSPEVDAMVGGANGLTVPDLLRPHGFLRHLSGRWRFSGFRVLVEFNVFKAMGPRNKKHVWACSSCEDSGRACISHKGAVSSFLCFFNYLSTV